MNVGFGILETTFTERSLALHLSCEKWAKIFSYTGAEPNAVGKTVECKCRCNFY